MTDGPHNLDTEMSLLGKCFITNQALEQQCVCHIYDRMPELVGTICGRCTIVQEIKKAWPSTYWAALEVFAKQASKQ